MTLIKDYDLFNKELNKGFIKDEVRQVTDTQRNIIYRSINNLGSIVAYYLDHGKGYKFLSATLISK